MYYELNKREKKIARQLIDKGLDVAYANALAAAGAIIENWRNLKPANRDTYLALYKEIDKHNEAIALRYNSLGGSKYLGVVVELFTEKMITQNDIDDFSDETKQVINKWSKLIDDEF